MLPSRDIRLIAFDVDGTLVDDTVYIWETLHTHFGCDRERRREAARAYHEGRLSYRGWFEHDVELLRERGADRQGILGVVQGLRPMAGAHGTLRELARRGYVLAILSGSIDLVVEHFFADVPFAHVFLNRFLFADDGALCGGEHTPYDMARKADGLAELALREGLTPAQCAFVGDNVNDLQVLRVAGLAIAVWPKHPSVAEAAHVVIDRGDLTQLLALFPERSVG